MDDGNTQTCCFQVLEYHPEPWDQWLLVGKLNRYYPEGLTIGTQQLPCLSGKRSEWLCVIFTRAQGDAYPKTKEQKCEVSWNALYAITSIHPFLHSYTRPEKRFSGPSYLSDWCWHWADPTILAKFGLSFCLAASQLFFTKSGKCPVGWSFWMNIVVYV